MKMQAVNEELRAVYEGMSDGLLIADAQDARFLRANPAICRMLGYTEHELLKMSVPDIHPADELPKVRAHFEALRDRQTTRTENVRCLRKDGTIFQAEVAANHLMFRGRPFLAGFFRDITERQQAEQAVRDSEARLRTLLENIPDLVLIVDGEGIIRFANRGFSETSAKEMIGWDSFSNVAPEHRERCRAAFAEVLGTGQAQAVETLDIYGHWWAVRIVPLTADAEPRQAMLICAEITQQKTAADAIQKEQQLLRQLLDLHERDRQLIAYEIHDGFAQQLTGALYTFEAFSRLQAEQPERARQSFDVALKMLGKSLSDARRLIGGIRPPILDEFGVVAAVDYLVCEAREQGYTEIEFSHDVQFDRLAPPLESAVFRIVQECLANACRHSQSKAIRVELRQQGDRLAVTVRDWGAGFDPSKTSEGRFGLQGIRERARLLGGQVAILTAPSQGTQVCVDLPVIAKASP